MKSSICLQKDYIERVYAGVLGKMIGVYLGRPFEGWNYQDILQKLGEIHYYVHDKVGVPLLVTDDDLSGTFTFVRALEDYGYNPELTASQIGQTWLNYIIENRSILWWGGFGNSTEHTAYLRLKRGIQAPESGCMRLNSQIVSEQIGAQIFIDGWAIVCPGEPLKAAEFAQKAAQVSHDGEAVYAAQLLAAMEAQAFVEEDIQTLLEVGLSVIPASSLIHQLVQALRKLHQTEPDWHKARDFIEQHYGYSLYGGNCHVIPNHALIILALLYGEGNFQKSLMIVNTAGWDTDCNSGNLGCLLGIRGGLATLEAGPDWRGPIADRLYIPTADGGRAITDAVLETYHLVKAAYQLHQIDFHPPKSGARFHFSLPGSVQGFQLAPHSAKAELLNTVHPHQLEDRCLTLNFSDLEPHQSLSVYTPTFIPPEAIHMPGSYAFMGSPTLYPGQTIEAVFVAGKQNKNSVCIQLFIQYYGPEDKLETVSGEENAVAPGEEKTLSWTLPDLEGAPIARVGFNVTTKSPASGSVSLDKLTWQGSPHLELKRPAYLAHLWYRAWVNAVDKLEAYHPDEPYLRLVQNEGRGLLIQGTREWSHYRMKAFIKPHLVKATGIAVCVQGMERYYGLLLTASGHIRLIKKLEGEQILAEKSFSWQLGQTYCLELATVGKKIQAWLNEELLWTLEDDTFPLLSGAIALLCEEGRTACEKLYLMPY